MFKFKMSLIHPESQSTPSMVGMQPATTPLVDMQVAIPSLMGMQPVATSLAGMQPEDNSNSNWFFNMFKNELSHQNKIKPICKSPIKMNIPIIKFPKIAEKLETNELEINELEPKLKKQKY